MGPEIGYPEPRVGPRRRARSISNGWSAISGRSWGNLGQPTADPGDSFCALIAAMVASILAHFSHSDVGLEMDPEICHS